MFLSRQLILFLIVAGIIAGFNVLDRVGLKKREVRVKVVEKFHREAKTITIYTGGRVSRVNPLPEEWVLKVETDGKLFEAKTVREIYERVSPGDTINANFTRSRIFRRVKIFGF